MRAFLIACLAVASGIRPAHAAENVRCTSVHDVEVTPGLSFQGTSGTVRVPTGTIECHGSVTGHEPTGPGPYHEEARYGTRDPDTCQDGGEGDGVFSFRIPTTGGERELAAGFTFTYGPARQVVRVNDGEPPVSASLVSGQFEGQGFRGTLEATPLTGNCVTEPVTRIRVKAQFHFFKPVFKS